MLLTMATSMHSSISHLHTLLSSLISLSIIDCGAINCLAIFASEELDVTNFTLLCRFEYSLNEKNELCELDKTDKPYT